MQDIGRKIGIKEEKKINITNPRHHHYLRVFGITNKQENTFPITNLFQIVMSSQLQEPIF